MTEVEWDTGKTNQSSSDLSAFLLADLRGYTSFTFQYGDEAASLATRKFETWARDVVSPFGGRIFGIAGDQVLCVFGSARSALAAALQIQSRATVEIVPHTDKPYQVGVGLDAGEAVRVDEDYRGGAVNLAARLCSLAAPSEILASESMVHLAGRTAGVRYTDRGLVQLKGFGEGVRVVQISPDTRAAEAVDRAADRPLPIGGFLGALPSTPMIGRGAELERALRAVDAVANGSGRLLLLAGEAGVGKTRFAQEITLHVRNREFLVAVGRCYQQRETVPFYPFLECLETLYATCPEHIRAQIPQRWPFLARILPDHNFPAINSSRENEDQERIFRSIAGFVSALSQERPVALLLDDLQWADDSSIDLLEHLARQTRGERVLLLGTFRDLEIDSSHRLSHALRALHREELLERIPIASLDQVETSALVAAILGDVEVSPEFGHLVQNGTEGNPFFARELLRALVERGDVYQENGSWERREIADIIVPETVRDAINERLSRLTKGARDTLDDASVLGPVFTFFEMQGIAGRAEDELEAAIDEGVRAGLIRDIEGEKFGFDHALTQQTLYAGISSRRKKRLHLAAAEQLSGLPEQVGAKRASEIANHFRLAGEPSRALEYVMIQARQANAVFAHEEAARQYQLALELIESNPEERRNEEWSVRALLGLSLQRAQRYPAALEQLELAASGFGQAGDLDKEAATVALIGHLHREQGTADEGVARLLPMLESLEPDQLPRRRAELNVAFATLYHANGQYAESLRASEQAADLARTIGDRTILVQAEGRRASGLAKFGHIRAALDVYEQGVEIAEVVGEQDQLQRIQVNMGFELMHMGELGQAEAHLRRGVNLGEAAGLIAGHIFGQVILFRLLFYRGEWQEARTIAEAALRESQDSTRSWSGSYPLSAMGYLDLMEGKRMAGLTMLGQALDLANSNRDLQGRRYIAGILAADETRHGDPGAAIQRLQPLMVEPHEPEVEVTALLPVMALARSAVGDFGRANDAVTEALRRSRHETRKIQETEALLAQGQILAAQRRWDVAVDALRQCTALAQAIPYRLAYGRSLQENARVLTTLGQTDVARRIDEEAVSVLRELGAGAFLESAT